MNNGYINFPDIGDYEWTFDNVEGNYIKIPKNTQKGIEIGNFINASMTKIPVFNGVFRFVAEEVGLDFMVNTCGTFLKMDGATLVSASSRHIVGKLNIYVIDGDNDYTISTSVITG